MLKLLKNCELYAPAYLGRMDLLIADTKIAAIAEKIDITVSDHVELEIIDCSNRLVVPGLIDSHAHLTGGGGEGGFQTRTPEILLTDITTAGITTVVGCLGTDGVTRSMENLYAKAKGLEEEGITTYIYSGSYRLPAVSLTGSILKDLLLIDKVIGAGEIAISDHRSCQPTIEQLKQLLADSRIGGILSGKAGIVCFHVGSGPEMFSHLTEILQTTELPYDQFIPTHINRNKELLAYGISHAKNGGFIDFTASSDSRSDDSEKLSASTCLKLALDEGVDSDHITFTSDGQGSLPVFDDNKHFVRLDIGRVKALHDELCASVRKYNIPMEIALKPVTCNPANLLKLKHKGQLIVGNDADILLLQNESLSIDTVIAKGRVMVKNGHAIVKGTFE